MDQLQMIKCNQKINLFIIEQMVYTEVCTICFFMAYPLILLSIFNVLHNILNK